MGMNRLFGNGILGAKGLVAVVMAVVLAVGLTPVPAFAASLEAGSVGDGAVSALITQAAKKKSVKVITGIKKIRKYSTSHDGLKSTTTTTMKLSYNKNGMLAKQAQTEKITGRYTSSTNNVTTTFSYDGKNNLKKRSTGATTFKYKTDSKGRITSYVPSVSGWSAKLTYKSGRLATLDTKDKAGHSYTSNKYSYDKKGRVSAISSPRTWVYDARKWKYSYDKKGNISAKSLTFTESGKNHPSQKFSYKNSYAKSGLISKSVAKGSVNGTGGSDGNYVETITFTYKTIEVSAKEVSKVEQQRWALVNENLNFALGITAL